MKNYVTQSVIKAVQWFDHGDHDQVAPFESPSVRPDSTCNNCGYVMEQHGSISGDYDKYEFFTVCPGDYIIEDSEGNCFPCKESIFEELYTPINSETTNES